ncbi:ATP-binding protein [Streptomyces sp. NPDC003333]
MIELPDLVTGGLAVGMLSALALGGLLLRAQRQQARQRAEIDRLHARLDEVARALTDEVEHLAARRLPAAARRQTHANVAVPGPLHPQTSGTPLGLALDHVLDALRGELTAQRTRIDAAAQAGMRGATREIQAALYRLQDALRGLQQKYDDPELTQTLFQLDHENEQSLRRAQVAAVVCGAWVGLAREESHLVDAVTGGQARLAGYHRVRVHNHLEAGTALVSHAVEPVAIIVAELLDNALRHSAPDTDVVVNLEHVHHGVCVTVDDAGLGMTQDERARAQRLVAGSEPILLTDLGDPPRMGLAAIGQLTRQFDLGVDLSSPSPYGGVRAVLRVDSRLLGHIDPEERPPAASAPRSTRPSPRLGPATVPGTTPATVPGPRSTGPSAEGDPSDSAHGYGSDRPEGDTGSGHRDGPDTGGLPRRRRRRRTRATAAPEEPAAPRSEAPGPEQAAAALGALQAGTAAARSATGGTTDEAEPAAAKRAEPAVDDPASGPGAAHATDSTARTASNDTTASTDTADTSDASDQADISDPTDHELTDHEGGTAR